MFGIFCQSSWVKKFLPSSGCSYTLVRNGQNWNSPGPNDLILFYFENTQQRYYMGAWAKPYPRILKFVRYTWNGLVGKRSVKRAESYFDDILYWAEFLHKWVIWCDQWTQKQVKWNIKWSASRNMRRWEGWRKSIGEEISKYSVNLKKQSDSKWNSPDGLLRVQECYYSILVTFEMKACITIPFKWSGNFFASPPLVISYNLREKSWGWKIQQYVNIYQNCQRQFTMRILLFKKKLYPQCNDVYNMNNSKIAMEYYTIRFSVGNLPTRSISFCWKHTQLHFPLKANHSSSNLIHRIKRTFSSIAHYG